MINKSVYILNKAKNCIENSLLEKLKMQGWTGRNNTISSPPSTISVWTDGCSNSQLSGWAVVCPSLKTIYRGILKDSNGNKTTNQKAELSAVIQAIHIFTRTMKFAPKNLTIITDSEYAIKCFTLWWNNWVWNGWKGSNGKSVVNRSLIELGLQMDANFVNFAHVNGHSGNEYNEMADWYCKQGQLKHSDWTLIEM